MESGKAWLAEVFSRAAATYDGTIPYFATFAGDVVERADIGPGERVLDAGCGRGACALLAARRVGPLGRVVGVDLAPGMVEAMLADAAEAGLDNVEGRVQDVESLTEPDEAYDAALSSYVFQFVYRPDRTLRHLHRVLAEGGRLVVATPNRHDLLWDFVQDLLNVYLMRVRKPVRPPPPPLDLPLAVANAGFRAVEEEVVAHSFVLADAEAWWDFAMSQGQRVVLEALDEHDRARFRARIGERLAEHATAEGIPVRAEARIVLARR